MNRSAVLGQLGSRLMKCGAFHLSATSFNLNWVSVRHGLIYLIVGTHYGQTTHHGELYQKGAMQIFPVMLWLTKPASEFQNGICPSWSLWLHVNTFTAFACPPVCQGELCLPSHEHLNWIFKLCPNHSTRSSNSAFGFSTRILSLFYFIKFKY